MPKYVLVFLLIYSASGIILATIPNTNAYLTAVIAMVKSEYDEGATFAEAVEKQSTALRAGELTLFPILNAMGAVIVLLIWALGLLTLVIEEEQELVEWYEEELALYISGGDQVLVEITNSFLLGKRLKGENVEVYSLKREVDGQPKGINGFKYSEKNPEGKWALLVPYSTIVEVTDEDVNYEDTYEPKEI